MKNIEEIVVDGLEQVHSPKMGLEKLVFGNATETTYEQEEVSVDIYDGARGIAGYTARGAKGQTIGLEGWKTIHIKPPLIDEGFPLTAKDLQIREKGKGNVNQKNRQEKKFKDLTNKNIKRLKDRRQRAFNKQIQELLTTGKVEIIEKDDKGNEKKPRYEDFKTPADHIYTVTTSWSDENADIWGDIDALDEKIVHASGLTPDYAIVGKNTIKNMIKNKYISKLMDSKQIDFGKLFKKDLGDGLIYWGNPTGKDIYTFVDFDKDGKPIIPDDAYIVGSTEAEVDIAYGSIDVIKDGQPKRIEAKIVYEKEIDRDSVSVKNKFKTAKLYCLTQSGAFGCLTTK